MHFLKFNVRKGSYIKTDLSFLKLLIHMELFLIAASFLKK